MTTKTLIKDGKLVKEGNDYRTNDGRLIERVLVGRSTTKWKVQGIDYLYRDLWCAYYDNKF